MQLRKLVWTGGRRWVTAAMVTLLLAGPVLVYLEAAHSFGLTTETLTIESGGNELAATLHLPAGDGPHGIVVFIPGDGTTDADPGALPIWEALADAGYATVKWDKPGVRNSTGDWLDQDMDDRASEVVSVVKALAGRNNLDTANVGVIGVSQGGWVIPLVAERMDVNFFIAWSTAVDWVEQGEYLTERLIANAGASTELADRVRRADRADRGDRGETYRDYLGWHDLLDDDVADFFPKMNKNRWEFVTRNKNLDAGDTLPALQKTPLLLLLGGRDDNVDVDDTERVYRDVLGGPCLGVIRYPDGDHSLLDHDGLGLTVTGIFQPRSIFAEGLLEDIRLFAAEPNRC